MGGCGPMDELNGGPSGGELALEGGVPTSVH